jgi:hypothetical protein
MGRSFESVRMGVKDISARWLKASKALKKEEQIYGQKVADMAKKHSSEAFYALNDPLEAGKPHHDPKMDIFFLIGI